MFITVQGLTWEDWLPKKQLGHHTSDRPDIDGGCVISCPKNQLRSSIESGADVADVRLPRYQHLQGQASLKKEHDAQGKPISGS